MEDRVKETAFITGGATRLGREFSLFLAEQGYDIALHFHQSDKEAAEVAEAVNALGKKCYHFKADLADDQQRQLLVERLYDECSDVTLLVNNAALFKQGAFLEMDEVSYEQHMGLNLKAPLFLMQAFARRSKKGQIINILDTKVNVQSMSFFAYLLSKKSLQQLTIMAAKELAPDVRVNAIAPGIVLPSEGFEEAYIKQHEATLPLQKKAEVKDCLHALQVILEASYMTGQCLFVDGGEHLL